MTNERAVEILKAIIFMLGRNYDTDEVEEAIHKAIEALQRGLENVNADEPTCNDFATNLQPSKQDVDDLISKLSEIRSQYNCFDEAERSYYHALSEAIKVLSGRADGDTISRQAAKEQKAEESLLRADDKSVSKDDVIYRQAAIDAIDKIFPADPMRDDYTQGITCGAALANIYVAQLPSAQPETHEERTETHACDLIDRQAAIDEIEERKNANGYRNVAVISELNRLEGYIKRLPSAQPERKKGKWIKHIDDLFPAESTIECSECHHEQSLTIDDNFCPNCGARMDGGEQDG